MPISSLVLSDWSPFQTCTPQSNGNLTWRPRVWTSTLVTFNISVSLSMRHKSQKTSLLLWSVQHCWTERGNKSRRLGHCLFFCFETGSFCVTSGSNCTVCFVGRYAPNIHSVTAEVSDEADTRLGELAQSMMLVRTPTWKASLGRHAAYCLSLCCRAPCDSHKHTEPHTHKHTHTSRWSVRVRELLESTDSSERAKHEAEGGRKTDRGRERSWREGQGRERKRREV